MYVCKYMCECIYVCVNVNVYSIITLYKYYRYYEKYPELPVNTTITSSYDYCITGNLLGSYITS